MFLIKEFFVFPYTICINQFIYNDVPQTIQLKTHLPLLLHEALRSERFIMASKSTLETNLDQFFLIVNGFIIVCKSDHFPFSIFNKENSRFNVNIC